VSGASARAAEVVALHHEPLRRWLPEVEASLVAAGARREVVSQWRRLAGVLEHHLMKEEVVVFPSLLLLERGLEPSHPGLGRLMGELDREHRDIDRLDATLRPMLAELGEAGRSAVGVLDDLRVHAGIEEAEIFPVVQRLLGG
jgi:hemerythrin-like domain-containing protein